MGGDEKEGRRGKREGYILLGTRGGEEEAQDGKLFKV